MSLFIFYYYFFLPLATIDRVKLCRVKRAKRLASSIYEPGNGACWFMRKICCLNLKKKNRPIIIWGDINIENRQLHAHKLVTLLVLMIQIPLNSDVKSPSILWILSFLSFTQIKTPSYSQYLSYLLPLHPIPICVMGWNDDSPLAHKMRVWISQHNSHTCFLSIQSLLGPVWI